MNGKAQNKQAQEIMNTRVEALRPDMPVTAAVQTLIRRGYSGAPVVDGNGALVGVLTEQECIRALAQSAYEGWPSGTVADHMRTDVATVGPREDVFAVAMRFAKDGCRRVFVVDGGRLRGMIARRELLRALDEMRAEAGASERSDTYTLIQIRHEELD